ncbi:hypothetical protein H109_06955 [Trichophyton interdigitale MR816]|uniref:Phosphatidate phosphatase APP1 catalytic domain-containing protein n=1 Tax=Trichophyton interdigitale (strain MR816) TaxID=1215338 RepID=A0A059IZR7_TRIIM|nr:hypothetical protein H101_05704 [Trichophyton interdigitale H6]KDB21111.1 hypothetical protein H109_06955 [Trichophyton interdigitale MR816]
MDFQIISDLHLETHPAYDFVIERTAPYLALLGDIGHLEHDQFFPFIEELLSRFEIVFLLFGNHEPQSYSMDTARRKVTAFQDRLSSRSSPCPRPPSASTGRFVFLSQTRFDVSDSLTVLGCTLYSHILPQQDQAVAARMSDFKMIPGWTTETHNRAHDADLAWLNAQVREIEQREPHRRIAIFSHHAPSLDPRAVDPKYAGSSVTSGFATELRDQPCWTSPAVTTWAFGHTHYNCDFELGGVRVIANQKGYYASPRDTSTRLKPVSRWAVATSVFRRLFPRTHHRISARYSYLRIETLPRLKHRLQARIYRAIVERQARLLRRQTAGRTGLLGLLFPRRHPLPARRFSPSLAARRPVKHGPGGTVGIQTGMLGSTGVRAEDGGSGSNGGLGEERLDGGGRERGARRKKMMGYLKAANELRQAYSAQWTRGYQDQDASSPGMPGGYPEGEATIHGDEEMILFPSYGRRHVRGGKHHQHSSLSTDAAAAAAAAEFEAALPTAQNECQKSQSDTAIVDVDARGWIYSPQRGPMNRKTRILLALARRLSGIQVSSATSSDVDDSSAPGSPKSPGQDDASINQRVDSIMNKAQEGVEEAQQVSQQMSPEQMAAANAQLMERLTPFLTIPAVNIPVTVFFFNKTQSQSRTISTNASGQFILRASLDFAPTHVRVLAAEHLSATEEVSLSDPGGVSLISDIDDTIKHSAIADGAKEMFRNTFVRNLNDLTIAGVGDWYTRLAELGVGVHYVSNSPWQLYPLLKKYFSLAGLPPGSFHLKQYSGMLQGIFEPTAERKRPSLERIIQDFPNRMFILVGDSGEVDLEIYTELAMANKGRILGIFIRDVTTSSVQGFFDRSNPRLERRRWNNSSIDFSSLLKTPENKPTLPPRRNTDREETVVPMGNLIDLDDCDDDVPKLDISSQKPVSTSVAPPKPAKPAGLRSAAIESKGSSNINNATHKSGQGPSSTTNRKPVPGSPGRSATLSRNPSTDSYVSSFRNQAANLYNQLPSAREYAERISSAIPLSSNRTTPTSSPKAKPAPPPVPPPRRSATVTNAGASISSSKTTPGATGTSSPSLGKVQEGTDSLDIPAGDLNRTNSMPPASFRRANSYQSSEGMTSGLNKREEMWLRRWERAKEMLDREGVPLYSWRDGGDVEEICLELVRKAQKKIGNSNDCSK